MQCQICGHHCQISEGGTGRCKMYTCSSSKIIERFPDKYLAIWPSQIETVPLLHFSPGGRYLLLSTLGCNLSCPGCVSHILVDHPDLIAGALHHAEPEEIRTLVEEHVCLGVIFCLNEPTVSLDTVIKTARMLKQSGYTVGCASNGCMEPQVVDLFLQTMDFMNIGLKGAHDTTYQKCGAPCTIEQVFSTIHRIFHAGVHLEVSVVFQHGSKGEVLDVAQRISQISPDIPLHVMRFIPFNDASSELEPSPDEAEMVCEECRAFLTWVYLFNTPGTRALSTFCPDCGDLLIERTFYGPMGARLTGNEIKSACSCGHSASVSGSFFLNEGCEPRYRGGYRTSVILDSISRTLTLLGVQDSQVVSNVLVSTLSGHCLENLQGYMATPERYIEYIRVLASLAEIEEEVTPLLTYYTDRLDEIRTYTQHRSRPRVYCALSHPFLPSYCDKMEVALTDRAGGEVLNYLIPHGEDKTMSFSREQFQALKPEVIICSGMGRSDVQTFLEHCRREQLTAPALETGRVFCIPREYASTSLSWVLILEWMVNILHQESRYDLALKRGGLRLRSPER
jgi:pyruvate-formate lyase-activating enzyme